MFRGIGGACFEGLFSLMVQLDNRSVSDFVSGTRKAFCVPMQMHSILRSKQNLMQIDEMYKREWVFNVVL